MTDRVKGGQLGAVTGTEPQLRLISRGDTPALDFEALFTAHYGFVCRALRSMGIPAAYVEDFAQDVFIVLHRRIADYDPSRDVRSWLWGIARRVASTHARTDFRAQRKLRALPDPTPQQMPDDQLELRKRAEVVAACLQDLTEDQRQVFMLVEIESLSAPQVADALGIKLNTVYSRLRGARARFQRAMQRQRARMTRSVDA